MAVVKESGELVDSAYINENYNGCSVLLVFKGKRLPVGQGYLVYSSNAETPDEARTDQTRLGDILTKEFGSDGVLSSGWGGVADLCTL